jgi:hypothetical protein
MPARARVRLRIGRFAIHGRHVRVCVSHADAARGVSVTVRRTLRVPRFHA